MSSSPQPLVPSVSASAHNSAPSPPSGHGSASGRVSGHLPSERRIQDLRISDPPSSSASLNPLAKEFVPDSPHDESFIGSELTEEHSSGISIPRNSVKRIDGQKNTREDAEPLASNGSQPSGGLSTAFRRGNVNQSRTPAASRGGLGSADGSSGQKRNQFTNANHLLNFQYDPIVRPPPPPRVSYSRKPQKVQPYDKELFLQANFRFLVSDYGDYLLNSTDPDKMLQWEDVAAVNISAPVPVQCPICLEAPPVCPQITSCGHIFCFPCILRYLALGEHEQRSDYFKKCPLCFAVTSSKALRTVFIDNVHNFQIGDYLEFTLLNRAKGSIFPFEKSDPVIGVLPYSKDGQCHRFSKFTLASDADYITDKAVTELSNWAEKAQNQSEDMELLPFVYLAIDKLQQRKSAWNEHRVSAFLSSSPPVRQRIMAQTKESSMNLPSQGNKSSYNEISGVSKPIQREKQKREKIDVTAETEAAMADLKDKAGWVYENAFSDEEGESGSANAKPPVRSNLEECLVEKTQEPQNVDDTPHVDKDLEQEMKNDPDDNETYAFYQSADGQPIIMHPINMKCLLQHYGSYEKLPTRLRVKILEMEGQIQTEALRKRYRYLSHLPLTTNFSLCEVDLRGHIPNSAFSLFIDEIRYRDMRRRRRLKQEQAARLKSEKSSVSQSRYSPPAEVTKAANDIFVEAPPSLVGAENVAGAGEPNREPVEERKLFSQVTRLGFASAHDAPDLVSGRTIDESVHNEPASSSAAATSTKSSLMSFADIIQTQPLKSAPNGSNGSGIASQPGSKKKKATKILLSTAGGRRY